MKGRGGKRPVNARERQGKKMFLMILPFLILCFLFSYFPLHGWIYAFYDYKAPLKLSQCPFVGFKWFRMFFSNETQMAQLWQVMKNTFAMSFLSIVTSILPLGFAIFLSEIKCKWFKSLVQTMTTIPNFILSYTYPESLDFTGFPPFSKFCLRPFYALFSYQAGVACSNWRTAFTIDSSVT